MAPLLEVDGLDSYYGQSHILRDLSMTVEEGSAVMVLGRNGVGKTTMMRSIMNLTPPRVTGRVTYAGEDISELSTFDINRRGIGFVPQERRTFGTLTVDQNLRLPLRGVDSPTYTPEYVYDLFPQLEELRQSETRNLSGGEQQMVAIGRGLVGNTQLLLLDEPLEGLAPTIVGDLKETLSDLVSELTMVIVEQSLSDAIAIADSGYVLDRGTVVFEGTAEEFREQNEEVQDHLTV